MHVVRSARHRFRKVGFYRLSGMTRPLPVRVPAVQYDGQEPISWFEDDDKWLNSNATDPMSTEPFGRAERAEIKYSKRCDCGLFMGEWCNCTR